MNSQPLHYEHFPEVRGIQFALDLILALSDASSREFIAKTTGASPKTILRITQSYADNSLCILLRGTNAIDSASKDPAWHCGKPVETVQSRDEQKNI